jgi:Ras-related protein Rab-5C
VGKSSIIEAFHNQKFNPFQETTLGAAYLTKVHPLPTGRSIKFHLWDTAGQEKYRSISSLYYKTARIAICVFDITSKHSFQVMKSWVEELKAYGPANAIIAIVGNKTDLF